VTDLTQSYLAQVEQVTAPPIDWGAMAPLLVVLGAACVAVLVEAFLPRHQRWPVQVALSIAALGLAGLALGLYAGSEPAGITTIGDALAVDRPTLFLWGTLLALGVGSILLIADRSVEPGGAFIASAAGRAAAGGVATATGGGSDGGWDLDDPDRSYGSPDQAPTMQTEVFPFTLFALSGMMTFVAANDLLTMFIALEVLSLPLYLMCGLARRRRLLSQEAAVKYFLLGAFASAFFLYGLALIYGYAGSVRFTDIANASAGSARSDTLLFGGFALLVVGLMFKGSVGPFHTWTPDVYQGAPTPVTAFMGACTKVAAFGGILRVLQVAFGATRWEWRGVLWAIAIVSMVIGAVLGLTQTDIKRMVAYSSVAHAGFLLIGAMAITPQGVSGTLFYLLAYGFTTLAVFGVISLVRTADGEATHLSQWAGLAKRSPVTAGIMTFLLLALAGIPLTSGFTAKFAVFAAGIGDGMAPLVVIALVVSAVAAFFYLRVIVLMYFSEPAAEGPTVTVPGAFTTAAITLGVLLTLLLGIAPSLALGWASGGTFAG
jgi:NADH-quinone oxidoreductase subunit N